MLNKVTTFIAEAIKAQELPYVIEPKDEGFTFSLDLTASAIKESNANESFIFEVTLHENDGKNYATIKAKFFSIERNADSLTLGKELPGPTLEIVEPEEVDKEADFWKYFIAKRWLLSILEFHKYAVKGARKPKLKASVVVLISVVLISILAVAFSGIAENMSKGAVAGFEEVEADLDVNEADKIVSEFFN